MGLPKPSRKTKFATMEEDGKYFIYSVQLAGHEHNWQPYPVVMAIHTNNFTATVAPFIIISYISHSDAETRANREADSTARRERRRANAAAKRYSSHNLRRAHFESACGT